MYSFYHLFITFLYLGGAAGGGGGATWHKICGENMGKQCFHSWGQKYSRDGKSTKHESDMHLLYVILRPMSVKRWRPHAKNRDKQRLWHPTFTDLYIVGGKALQTEIEREGRGSKGGQREDTAGRRIRKIRKEDTTFIKIYIDLDPKPPKTMGTLLTSCLFSALCCFNDRFPCALACAWGTTGVVGGPRVKPPWSDPILPVRVTLCLYVSMWTSWSWLRYRKEM